MNCIFADNQNSIVHLSPPSSSRLTWVGTLRSISVAQLKGSRTDVATPLRYQVPSIAHHPAITICKHHHLHKFQFPLSLLAIFDRTHQFLQYPHPPLQNWQCELLLLLYDSNKEENNCFFSGSSYCGPYQVLLTSDNTNCAITKFNFVNNTDSSGYF